MKRFKAALLIMPLFLTMSCSDKIGELKEFADRACECKEAACGEKVMGELVLWAKKNKNARG